MSNTPAFFGSYGRITRKDPPIKGSFPFDLERECKAPMLNYMLCMHKNQQVNEDCRPLAMEYFKCRMDKGLMDRQPLEVNILS